MPFFIYSFRYRMLGRPLITGFSALLTGLLLLLSPSWFPAAAAAAATSPSSGDLLQTIETLSAFGDRSTGSTGSEAAADFILKQFKALGFKETGTHYFSVPVRVHAKSALTLPFKNRTETLHPFTGNAVSPGTIPPTGLKGPLVYVGRGELKDFNDKPVEGAIILMELDSGKNWLHAANLGARALIYVDRGLTPKMFFEEAFEFSPIHFPRFWMPLEKLRALFGQFEDLPGGLLSPEITLSSEITWREVSARNIYCLIPGSGARLKEQLIIIEAFYDSTARIPGRSPGADEALSVATLLDLARRLKDAPPERSVLLVASGGHAQTLAGMREMIWSLKLRSSEMRKLKKELSQTVKETRQLTKLLKGKGFTDITDPETAELVREAVNDRIKTEVDILSRRLIQLRMQEKSEPVQHAIKALAQHRLLLRRLGWRKNFANLDETEQKALATILPKARKDQQAILADALNQTRQIKSAAAFRSLAKAREIAAVISLHLSSHGDGIGAFNNGWLYDLKPAINRVAAYSKIDDVLKLGAQTIAREPGQAALYRDTLRPSRIRPWQSYFVDQPLLGGEVSAMAGFLGFTLATVNDARPLWGTPHDLPRQVDPQAARQQSRYISSLVSFLAQAPALHEEIFPRNGFSTISGRAKFLRHGELFADQAAPESVLLAYQGLSRFYAMVDTRGRFQIKGVADKKHVLSKVIIEGYRFDPDTGRIIWAIDKNKTGKNAYRVKMQRRSMETDLVMFACKETTLFSLLEPRNLRYMTRIQLLDARHEATPLRYWYSRIDTRASIITSTYLEPGTLLKMTLSDSVTQKKLILTHASKSQPEGSGYLVDDWPMIHRTAYQVARDMWLLLAPRIENLEKRGIYNEKIRELQLQGTTDLNTADYALKSLKYDRFAEAAARSWALAIRVYDHVEKTQKDVLFGVLFYIALFVPFAFCLERLLFSFTNIYKRIVSFSLILIVLIAIIYKVHPAFQLAYSPMVVILAFFIMGLSLMVTLIIFFRFEDEMILLQQKAQHVKTEEIGRWKAIAASFFLGVSNLRRRRLRTFLTCTTLIILTFTIMSFTSVKSMRHHARLLYQENAPYQGFLLKNFNWNDLPPEAVGILSNAIGKNSLVAPRVWLETDDRTHPTSIPIRYGDRRIEAQGLVGLDENEKQVTAINRVLIGGRWLRADDRMAVILPDRLAAVLGIDAGRSENTSVSIWGMPFDVIGVFDSSRYEQILDLDGEPLTPVTFPSEAAVEMTEVEMDALEAGEDIQSFQSRYQHLPANLTLIVPYRTLLGLGGRFKGVGAVPSPELQLRPVAHDLVDRFGLILFSGEPKGSFLYNASDTLNYSGVPNIVIPLIISVFIVLNTMIGSVYERKREIAIYTSVGLAPSHVSFLFIAEAVALAVLSVVLGYLLAQTSASLFAGTPLWAGITVNYSSLAGVAAMLLVILVVLISVIYPSRVAAEIAIPDVNRSWTLPQAVDNTIEVTLPFLMKYAEHHSIGGFIYDYIKSHQDVSHGTFSTGDIRFDFVCPIPSGTVDNGETCPEEACHREACLRFFSKVWLAPFDFGIMQQVEIQFCPAAEDGGYLEIKARLTRLAGEANAWRRINKPFLHALRKQLLLWRSLDAATHAYYVKLLAASGDEAAMIEQGK